MRIRRAVPTAGAVLFLHALPLLAAPDREPAPAPLPEFVRDIAISVHTSPETLTVGDHVQIELRVEAPAGVEVAFQAPQGSAAVPIEVQGFSVERPEPTGREKGDADGPARATWLGRCTLAVFGVGEITLPPWPVQVRADTQVAVVLTDSVRLRVQSVLDDSLAAADFRDIKPQRQLPVPLPVWLWVLLGALAAAGLALWWMLRRRRRRPAPMVPVAPPRPAHEVALAELRKLESMRLPFEGKIKAHYIRLSEILRRYLEESLQFAMAALEETTFEIVRELRGKGYKPQIVDEVAGMCEEADLVKFAKYEPTIEECNAALERVRRFVLDSSRTTALLQLRAEPEPELAAVGATAAGVTAAGALGSAQSERPRGDGTGRGGDPGAAGGGPRGSASGGGSGPGSGGPGPAGGAGQTGGPMRSGGAS